MFNDEVTDRTIEFIKNHDIEKIYPAHCLNQYAFDEFKKIGGERIKTHQELIF